MQYVRDSQIYFPSYFMNLNILTAHIYNILSITERLTFLPAGREDGNSHWTIQNSFHHDHHISPCVFFSPIHTIYNISFMEKYFKGCYQI